VTLNGRPGLGYDLDIDAVAASISPKWADSGGTLPGRRRPSAGSRRTAR
jgi:hypothetical protein